MLRQIFFIFVILSMTEASSADSAKVIMLGSGTPVIDPTSSGPCVAVVVNGQAYLFDAGPGVVRRAQAASEKFGIAALNATNLNRLFITHLHSDHTLGYPDVIFSPWVVGRSTPLEVYGPAGLADMTKYLKLAYGEDIKTRTEGVERLNPRGSTVNVHEIAKEGVIFQDPNVTISAISVQHGSWASAFAYKIVTAGRTIVISGDTTPSEAIVEACKACDVLVHEVYSADRFDRVFGPVRGKYHSSSHTSTTQLAELANRSKPKLLVLYHQLYFGPRQSVDLVKEIRRTYEGAVVSGIDLAVY